jgi:putative membrane protein
VPVAIVNGDNPVKTGSGDDQKTVAAGRQLAASLTRPDPDDETPLSWQIVDSADAAEGLRDGVYYAVLTIPKDFSAQLTSTSGDKPQQAELKLVGNDASSIAVTAMASLAVDRAASALGAQATNGFVDNTLSSFTTINKNLTSTAKNAHQLADSSHQLASSSEDLASGTQSLKDGAAELASGAAQASAGAAQLSTGAAELASSTGSLEGGAEAVASAAERTARLAATGENGANGLSGLAEVQDRALGVLDTATGALAAGANGLRNEADRVAQTCPLSTPREYCQRVELLADRAGLPARAVGVVDGRMGRVSTRSDRISTGAADLAELNSGLDELTSGVSTGAADVSSGAAELDTAAASLASGAAGVASGTVSVANGADQNAAGADQVDHGADQLASGAEQLASGADSLASGLDKFAESVPSYTDDQRKTLDTVVTTPVTVTSSADHQSTVAAGLVPVVLALALWLGTLMIFLVGAAVPAGAAWAQASVGRRVLSGWAPAVLVGLAQAALLLAFVFFGDVKVASSLGLAFFCGLGVLSFAAVNQALVALFGGVGRLVSLAFTVVEAAALGGLIPIETAPSFIQLLNGVLPLPRFVDGAGQLVLGGGSGDLIGATVVLLLWMFLGLGATALATARRRPELAPARLAPPPAAVSVPT